MSTPLTCTKVFTITVPSSYYAYFKCDEASPIAQLNNSVDAFHLPLVSAIPGTSVAGKIGTAITADGDYHTYRQTDNHWRFTDFTLRFWYKPSNILMGAHAFIYNEDVSFTVSRVQIAPGTVSIRLSCATTGGTVSATADFAAAEVNAWNMITCWFEETVGLGIQINTNAAVTQATADPLDYAFASAFVIGIDHHQTSPEAVDEVALWNRKISDAEITADWNNGNGRTI